MANLNTFTWQIIELGCYQKNETYPDLVVNAKWLYTISDNLGNETGIEGFSTFDTESIESFIPFNNLTESIVIQWVESKENVEKLQKRLIDQLDEKVNPSIVIKQLT